ncbi:MAG: UPF0182 family protein [Fimbriimonadaceae bacterium]|nr:UPF0182 family protein [Fimbriimonadaceae bacterium]
MRRDFDFDSLGVGSGRGTEGPTRGQLRVGCSILGLVALLVLLLAAIAPYTDYLWYVHDARQPQVYLTAYAMRGKLFVVGFVVALGVLLLNLGKALTISVVYDKVPQTPAEMFLSNAVAYVQNNTGKVSKVVSTGLALLFGLSLQSAWNAALLASNSQVFGKNDPTFGMDLGFFVFKLPWLQVLANYAFGLLFVTTFLTTGIYLGLKALASLARIDLGRPAERVHVGVLVGLTAIAYAVQLWLHRYEFGLIDSAQFTGAGLAGMRRLAGLTAFTIVLAAVGLVSMVFAKRIQRVRPVLVVGGSLFVLYVLLLGVVPGLSQRLEVEPNKFEAEGPFALKAITMTRFAYGLDGMEVRESQVRDEPTAQEVAAAQPTLENMRLWDPEVLRRSIEGIQGLRPYYTFQDVDIDRYLLDGKQTLVMLSPRDIRVDGLSASARTWVNERLQYTHGYGLTMSPVNTATTIGQPTFVINDMPPKAPASLPVDEPRIYYSDFRDGIGRSGESYAIVDTKIDEFDYPGQDSEQKTRWKGTGGVPIGSPLTKAVYSLALGDGNLLVSGNITSTTRLLYRRGVVERASLIFPFLHFDNDPYIVVFGGRLLWILDAYTTTGQVPYSARVGGPEPLNYIRNSVKVVIDAYTGETTGYAVEPDEPILKAYRKIYPGLVKDPSAIPEGLRSHFRYPEDLFSLQSMQLAQYHVNDTTVFLNNEDAWDLAFERNISGDTAQMRPYYVQLQLPGEAKDGFMLILPFTPRQKGNLSGWLAAQCDPDEYGKLVLYKYPKGANIAGPTQMEARFNQDPVIADLNRQFNNDQSQILVGNLLVVPIGRSVMYVEPMFLQSRTSGIQPIPELKKVILGLNNKVVVADTYRQALEKLFGDGSAAPERVEVPPDQTPPKPENPPSTVLDAAQVQELKRLLEAQDEALRKGDFARFGALREELRKRIEALEGPR